MLQVELIQGRERESYPIRRESKHAVAHVQAVLRECCASGDRLEIWENSGTSRDAANLIVTFTKHTPALAVTMFVEALQK